MAQTQYTKYIALFHGRDNASAAIRDLEAIGYTGSALTVIGGGNGTSYSEADGTYGAGYGYGTQAGLADVGVPEKDRKHLEDGLSAGGTILVLEGEEDRDTEIEKIFHKHSTSKIDEAEVSNRDLEPPVAPVATAPVAAAVDSTVIPVTEEDLVVGKREVDRGGVRVFRRVVEQPATASVSLREEHVVLDRHPVDRAVTEADLRSGERVIELTETAEEAVIGKTARVVEEVHVGKIAEDHTETVHDTVRHTEVEVEELPATTTGQSGNFTNKL